MFGIGVKQSVDISRVESQQNFDTQIKEQIATKREQIESLQERIKIGRQNQAARCVNERSIEEVRNQLLDLKRNCSNIESKHRLLSDEIYQDQQHIRCELSAPIQDHDIELKSLNYKRERLAYIRSILAECSMQYKLIRTTPDDSSHSRVVQSAAVAKRVTKPTTATVFNHERVQLYIESRKLVEADLCELQKKLSELENDYQSISNAKNYSSRNVSDYHEIDVSSNLHSDPSSYFNFNVSPWIKSWVASDHKHKNKKKPQDIQNEIKYCNQAIEDKLRKIDKYDQKIKELTPTTTEHKSTGGKREYRPSSEINIRHDSERAEIDEKLNQVKQHLQQIDITPPTMSSTVDDLLIVQLSQTVENATKSILDRIVDIEQEKRTFEKQKNAAKLAASNIDHKKKILVDYEHQIAIIKQQIDDFEKKLNCYRRDTTTAIDQIDITSDERNMQRLESELNEIELNRQFQPIESVIDFELIIACLKSIESNLVQMVDDWKMLADMIDKLRLSQSTFHDQVLSFFFWLFTQLLHI
jgi:hypothetical protein